jgi:hypothetical protein
MAYVTDVLALEMCKILHLMSEYQLLKENSASWGLVLVQKYTDFLTS